MIAVRPIVEADRPFVISGWSASYRDSRDLSFISMVDYATIMHSQIERLLANPRFETLVLWSSDVRAGFICFERPDYVVYVYVAGPYRSRGFAHHLLDAAGIDPTSRFEYAGRTRASWMLVASGKLPAAKYNPYRARFERKEQR